MMYKVYNESHILYEGNDFREAFSVWKQSKGNSKINVPISSLPKMNEGDDFTGGDGVRYIVDDFEIRVHKNSSELVYHVFDESGKRKKFSASEIAKFKGGGIVDDYQRIKEGLIFKNEYLAQMVEKFVGETPEFWFERVGKMIYASNKKYIDALELKTRELLSQIEKNTDYVSKMINDRKVKNFTFDVEYDNGNEVLTVMAFDKEEAKSVALKKISEKTRITGKKMRKLQILAPQK